MSYRIAKTKASLPGPCFVHSGTELCTEARVPGSKTKARSYKRLSTGENFFIERASNAIHSLWLAIARGSPLEWAIEWSIRGQKKGQLDGAGVAV